MLWSKKNGSIYILYIYTLEISIYGNNHFRVSHNFILESKKSAYIRTEAGNIHSLWLCKGLTQSVNVTRLHNVRLVPQSSLPIQCHASIPEPHTVSLCVSMSDQDRADRPQLVCLGASSAMGVTRACSRIWQGVITICEYLRIPAWPTLNFYFVYKFEAIFLCGYLGLYTLTKKILMLNGAKCVVLIYKRMEL